MSSFAKRPRRAGSILVLTVVMLVVLFGCLAFAIDIGYLMVVRTELQASADSAAMAGAWNLLQAHLVTPPMSDQAVQSLAKESAHYYAGSNPVAGDACTLADDDITFGRFDFTAGQSATMDLSDPSRFNAVMVRVRRTSAINGEIPLFFARLLGVNSSGSQAVATAAFADNFQGFKAPVPGGPNLNILPIALDLETWNALLAGYAGDHWAWDENSKTVAWGSDGVLEANLYPQRIGAPGNRGTVDIGNHNNSTRDLSRQIVDGISAADIAQLPGGELAPGPDGTILLNGDTGLSAAIKRPLASIVGQTRVIPIFSKVVGQGNRAYYTIVQFAGVRILGVDLTGPPSTKYLMIQPAAVLVTGGIPAPDNTQLSQFLYSKNAWLVR